MKKPPPTFEAVFVRPDLRPEQVSVNHLSRALSAVQRLATAQDTHEESSEGRIGLLGVRRGSAAYQLSAPFPALAIEHLRLAGKILEQPETIGESDYVLSPVEELSAIAKSLQCSIVLREPGKQGAVLARIGSDSYSIVSEKLLISGDTIITGKVMRVGGATEKKCGLRIPTQIRMLFCQVETTETARKLGQKLYQEVAVSGTAKWIKTSWRLVSFKIRQVHQPKLRPVEEMIEALRNAGGAGWDSVDDPEAFIEEVSGER